jgi:phage-related protein
LSLTDRLASGARGVTSPADRMPFEIEFYADESGDKPCLRWIRDDLSPTKRRALGTAMNEVLQRHGVQVVGERSWGRQLGQGLFEFRLDRTVKPDDEIAEKLVLRVFCHAHGDRKILVLHGYDKGRSPSSRRQQREIEIARSRLASWRAMGAEKRRNPPGRRGAASKPAARRKR